MTLAEAALLASLPKAPSRLALTKNMGEALKRQRLILGNMLEERWITREQYEAALEDNPVLAPGAVLWARAGASRSPEASNPAGNRRRMRSRMPRFRRPIRPSLGAILTWSTLK